MTAVKRTFYDVVNFISALSVARLEALSHPFASVMRFMDAYLLSATDGCGEYNFWFRPVRIRSMHTCRRFCLSLFHQEDQREYTDHKDTQEIKRIIEGHHRGLFQKTAINHPKAALVCH